LENPALRTIVSIFTVAVSLAGGQARERANPVPAHATSFPNTVNLSHFGPAGQGGDDTAIIQGAIGATAARGQRLEIPAAASSYNVEPLVIPNGANILLEAGVTIQAMPGYGVQSPLISLTGVSNVSITGSPGTSIFRMNKSEYTSGETRHCLRIADSSNVQIAGIACNDSGGDGLYISGTSANISVTDSTFDNNRRQGLTIVSGNNIFVNRCLFTNTNGTSPQDGIDMEPNSPADQLTNIVIEDSYSDNNAGNGIGIDTGKLDGSSAPVSITVLRHHTNNNGQSGYYATNQLTGTYGVSGNILVTQSSSMLDQEYGAVASFYNITGAALTFTNLTVINANQAGSNYDNAATAVKRGGGGAGIEGNVYFISPTILDTTGKLHCFFTIRDFSNIGFANIQFVTPLQLSSAIPNLPLALVNGQIVASVNVP